MQTMAKLGRSRHLPALAAVILTFSVALGCASSKPLHPIDPAASTEQLPFHSDIAQPDGGGDAGSSDHRPNGGLPFRAASHPRVLPSGTLLTVDLKGSLSTPKVHAGDSFTASVAAPLAIKGETLVEPGTIVSGRVESAQSQPGHRSLVSGAGYFRLTLNSMTVDGKPVLLHTSSLFAKGTVVATHVSTSPHAGSEGLLVQKGRPLTFRLIAPVAFDDVTSASNR